MPNRTPSPTLPAPKPVEAGVIFRFDIRLFNSLPAVPASRSTTTLAERPFFDWKAVPRGETEKDTLNVSMPDVSPFPKATPGGRLFGPDIYIL